MYIYKGMYMCLVYYIVIKVYFANKLFAIIYNYMNIDKCINK